MIARELCRRCSPETFKNTKLEDNCDYAGLLKRTMDHVNTGGHNVILTPGRYNAAYFEHSYLAEKTGAHLVNGSELFVENNKLYYLTAAGEKERVGAIYRRISDEYGKVLDEVVAPVDGRIFFIHNAPLTYANTAVIKLVR